VPVGDSLKSAETKHPNCKVAEDSTGASVLAGDLPGGVWVRYRIVNDRVAEFSWNVHLTQSSPALAEIADPAGDSFANAILDMQSGESTVYTWSAQRQTPSEILTSILRRTLGSTDRPVVGNV
jgi:hypothetical protein